MIRVDGSHRLMHQPQRAVDVLEHADGVGDHDVVERPLDRGQRRRIFGVAQDELQIGMQFPGPGNGLGAEIDADAVGRLQRGEQVPPAAAQFHRLVGGMSDLLRRTLGEQITIETAHGGGLWMAHADPNQLEVAISNLAVNARNAMPNGGKLTLETANIHLDEKIRVDPRTRVLPGQYVMLAVTDKRIEEYTANVKAKAFDPFFTTKDIGPWNSLGL